MEVFGALRILKVCPGKLSKTINIKETGEFLKSAESSIISATGSLVGELKLHLTQVKISKPCMNYIKDHLGDDVFITFCWSILDNEDSITSPEKLQHRKAKFDFTTVYSMLLNPTYVDRLTKQPMIFRMSAITKDSELYLSKTRLVIHHVYDILNVKEHHRLVFENSEVDPTGNMIAYLDLWYKLIGKHKELRGIIPDGLTKRQQKQKDIILDDMFSKKSQNFTNIEITDSELDLFADSVWLVLNRNKVLKTTSSDIHNELQERVRWLHFEANWKQTLQENAILHGKNPDDIIWRQWREEDTINVRLRTYNNIDYKEHKPVLSITIVDLYFIEGASVLRNDEMKQFYVDYTFLGYEGQHLECPYSKVTKGPNQRMVFNFKKSFPIDIEKNYEHCKMITDLIRYNGVLRFFVISEPLPDKDKPIQTCQEVGFAEVVFNDLIQLTQNEDKYEYEVVDIKNSMTPLGYLTIKITGLLAMRKMALKFLAPKDYTLYT